MEKFTKLKSLVQNMENDTTNFYLKGNKSAGDRIRKKLLLIKALSQEIRLEVLAKNKENKQNKENKKIT